MTKEIKIGNVTIGGGRPIAVQSMLNVHNSDLAGNLRQARELEAARCDIVRVAVPNMEAVRLVDAIKSAVEMPLVCDIHFDYKIALECVAAGADKIRINPGNIGSGENVAAVVNACKEKNIPIRVGVNSGSVEKDILAKYGAPTAEALVESAKRHIALIEKNDYDNIVVSLKSSDLRVMVRAYRLMSESCRYPLHLGVTEAGPASSGVLKSAVGIGSLLLDGIGDTLRVSLTDDPVREVEAGRSILRAVGKLPHVEVVSCPTCGRTEIDIVSIADEVQQAVQHIEKPLKVAVMGCVVNGPGEAAGADVGIAGGKDCALLFKKGATVRKLEKDFAKELIEEIHKMLGEE